MRNAAAQSGADPGSEVAGQDAVTAQDWVETSAKEIAALRKELASHPVASCPDRETHARWARKLSKARAQKDQLQRAMRNRTGSLARQFAQVTAVLEDLGYLTDGRVTAAGETLARVYAEKDLLIAHCLRAGVWDGLQAADLAAAVTALVYEPRGSKQAEPLPVPGSVRGAIRAENEARQEVYAAEVTHGIEPLGGADPEASGNMWRWASGKTLASALEGEILSPGDFVRLASRVVDVLGQIRAVAPSESLYRAAASAIDHLSRGVVPFDAG
jgi:ATP-dependent RNA helicase HelY